MTQVQEIDGRLHISTPYNAAFVADIKAIAGRRWHGDCRAWSVPASARKEALEILQKHFPNTQTKPVCKVERKNIAEFSTVAEFAAWKASVLRDLLVNLDDSEKAQYFNEEGFAHFLVEVEVDDVKAVDLTVEICAKGRMPNFGSFQTSFEELCDCEYMTALFLEEIERHEKERAELKDFDFESY